VWRGAKQIVDFWCFCKESTSLHVITGIDIYSRFLLVLYKNITSFFNITIFFSYSTFIILIVYTWYSITCSCFTRVLVIALAFTCLLYSFAWYSTCCFALFILLDIRSCRVSFLWLRSAPLHYLQACFSIWQAFSVYSTFICILANVYKASLYYKCLETL